DCDSPNDVWGRTNAATKSVHVRHDELVRWRIRQLDGSEDDAGGQLGGVNGASGLGMLGQFFGDGFRELRADVPEKGMPSGTEQAHEAVTDKDEAGEFEKALGHIRDRSRRSEVSG